MLESINVLLFSVPVHAFSAKFNNDNQIANTALYNFFGMLSKAPGVIFVVVYVR